MQNKLSESSKFIKRFKSQLVLQMMVMPGLIFLLVFAYIPMFGIVIAFQDYRITSGIMNSNWVGLKHFIDIFTDPQFASATWNTIILSLLNIFIVFPAPLVFALILNEIPFLKLKKITQTSSYLPHFLAWVSVATMWTLLLDPQGMVNQLLVSIGFIERPIAFWSQPQYFRILAVLVSIWKGLGWGAIIFLASIAGINPELYEAATIDGAGRLRRIVNITLPSISRIFYVLLVLNIAGLVRGNLDLSYLLGNVFTRSVSYVLEFYTLDMGLNLMRYSFATAVGLFQSVISLILVVFANWASGKVSGNRLF